MVEGQRVCGPTAEESPACCLIIMVSVEQLECRVGSKVLLSDVSIALAAGEVLAVLGPNGAGKSTLLKCLSGEKTPTAGAIRIGERMLTEIPARETARWRGVLPQSSRIPFEFRVMEIVLLGRSPHLHGAETKEDVAIAREALAINDALHLAGRTVNTLSGGELQRVHMARVLAQIWEPVAVPGRLLLLDEPTASLDLKHQHSLLRRVRMLAENGVAVLVILHDLNLAAAYADRLLFLKEGRVKGNGIPCEVITSELIADIFEVSATVVAHPSHRTKVLVVQSQSEPVKSCETLSC